MKLLIPIESFKNYSSNSPIPLECKFCKKTFYMAKHYVQAAITKTGNYAAKFCSKKCFGASCKKEWGERECEQCGKKFSRSMYKIKRVKHNFCSQSCSGTYYNAHKKHGGRRSKLELFLEKELKLLYPNLNILFNDRHTIGLELDIYIPSLRLAFELNGIFHYEPIFGPLFLGRVQERDKNKTILCFEKQIDLAILDCSSFENYNDKHGEKFLKIVCDTINNRSSNKLEEVNVLET